MNHKNVLTSNLRTAQTINCESSTLTQSATRGKLQPLKAPSANLLLLARTSRHVYDLVFAVVFRTYDGLYWVNSQRTDRQGQILEAAGSFPMQHSGADAKTSCELWWIGTFSNRANLVSRLINLQQRTAKNAFNFQQALVKTFARENRDGLASDRLAQTEGHFLERWQVYEASSVRLKTHRYGQARWTCSPSTLVWPARRDRSPFSNWSALPLCFTTEAEWQTPTWLELWL